MVELSLAFERAAQVSLDQFSSLVQCRRPFAGLLGLQPTFGKLLLKLGLNGGLGRLGLRRLLAGGDFFLQSRLQLS